jgi:hypothetical protein
MPEYTIEYIRNMVKRGILLGPEAGQALLDEIDRANKILDEQNVPDTYGQLSARIAYLTGRHESELVQARMAGMDQAIQAIGEVTNG